MGDSDDNGHFSIRNVQVGKHPVNVSCLGYVALDSELNVTGDRDDLVFRLCCADLELSEVVVTARENRNSMSTSRVIDKAALEHLQMVNVSDVSSLLPGGKTVNPNLMKDNVFSIRDGGVSQGNASFGDLSGASTRNIASSNVESIEVITGIPSVEYGDLTSGVVKVKTRKGKTPYTATFTTNPKTKQFSLSKGFDLGRDLGSLNVALEHTHAINNPVSPYTTYQRNGIALNYARVFRRGSPPLNFSVALTKGQEITETDYKSFEGQQGICPEGWYMPTEADASALIEAYRDADQDAASSHAASIEALNAAGFNVPLVGMRMQNTSAAPGAYSPGTAKVSSGYVMLSTGSTYTVKEDVITCKNRGMMFMVNASFERLTIADQLVYAGSSVRCIKKQN